MATNVSIVLHHRMQQLVNMARTRKYQRKHEIQSDISNLEQHVANGFRCEEVYFRFQQSAKGEALEKNFKNGNGRIFFDRSCQGWMMVENLRPDQFKK